MMEFSRRIYLKHHGNLKGFGKIAKFYRDGWRPDVRTIGGYKGMWNSDVMLTLRKTIGME